MSVNTATFEERAGGTLLTLEVEAPNPQAREEMLRIREQGQQRAFELLEETARCLAAGGD